jgi:hypothetical protein
MHLRDLNLDSLDPSYRRATVNMALATLCCEKLLAKLPEGIDKNQISFVVATHFGEVHSTLEFLNTYNETKTPRPILFQNSLHNSTLGFASIQLGLTGPGLTISCDHETEFSAKLTCENLLELTPYVLLCFIDCIPSELSNFYLEKFPFLEKHLDQASAFLYSRD